MKYWIFTLLLSALILLGCNTQNSEPEPPQSIQNYNANMAPKDIPSDADVRQTTLAIKDMTCPSCALGVEYQLKQLDGVYDAQIKYPDGTGLVIYDSAKITSEKIAESSTIYKATVASDEQYKQ